MESLVNTRFWKNKKVLITGHTGFKGAWLSLWLQRLGSNVIGFSAEPPTIPNIYTVAGVGESMFSIIEDIRDYDKINGAVKKNKPEIIFHLAAQSLVRYSYNNPLETYSTNVLGTANLLEAIRKNDSTCVVICITSDKCYENKEWTWGYRENDMLGGYDPYSSSKACSELVISSYRNSYFSPDEFDRHNIALASTRAGNVIGGGDWSKDRLVADIMTSFLNDKKVIIRNPHAIRPWQHVLEPLRGYINLAEKMWNDGAKYSQAWNFGPHQDDAKPVSYIVDYISKLWGDGSMWVLDDNDQPHESNYLRLDCSKVGSLLNWHPILNLDLSLEWVVEWYKHYKENNKMNEFTMHQIATYENLTNKNVKENSINQVLY